MFVTIKPQHLSSVASDANAEFTAQIEERELGLLKGTDLPKISQLLSSIFFFHVCIVSTNLGLHDFVVAPQRLDSASLSTSRFFFLTSQEVRGLFLCIMLSRFLPLVTLGKKNKKRKCVVSVGPLRADVLLTDATN